MPTKKYVYITEDNVHFHHGEALGSYNTENLNQILTWARNKLDETLDKVNKEEVKDLDKQEEAPQQVENPSA